MQKNRDVASLLRVIREQRAQLDALKRQIGEVRNVQAQIMMLMREYRMWADALGVETDPERTLQ